MLAQNSCGSSDVYGNSSCCSRHACGAVAVLMVVHIIVAIPAAAAVATHTLVETPLTQFLRGCSYNSSNVQCFTSNIVYHDCDVGNNSVCTSQGSHGLFQADCFFIK